MFGYVQAIIRSCIAFFQIASYQQLCLLRVLNSLVLVAYPIKSDLVSCWTSHPGFRRKTTVLLAVRAVSAWSINWVRDFSWHPFGEQKGSFWNRRRAHPPIGEHPFGLSFVFLLLALWKLRLGTEMNLSWLLICRYFNVLFAWSRQTGQYLS